MPGREVLDEFKQRPGSSGTHLGRVHSGRPHVPRVGRVIEEDRERLHDIGRERRGPSVGAPNGQNPISVIIPCQRLSGKNGSLTDYGGGLDRKRKLLELEGAIPE